MSDPKRATLITVGAPKSAKASVNKTVRLTINLDESNESKYPELNYKELVIAEEKKNRTQNGKTAGLDPFSDNDDDVERVARKFEQKYGGKSTFGKRKGRSKQDDFADIGAGYDETDPFIDNTHGYDEMIPPECDTLYGGFYINSGSLEFKTVQNEQSANSDEPANRRNKRRISSSSSEDSSDSSSESESQEGADKDQKAVANGALDSHKTEHRKKKNKKVDKQKANKVRRTDSSAATSGKQTSDENAHADAESADCADSRTSQSDSLTSKPAPSSENAVTSDSSRDVDAKVENKLPAAVGGALAALEASVARLLMEQPAVPARQLLASHEDHLLKLEQALKKHGADACSTRAAWARAALGLGTTRAKLAQRVKLAQEKLKGDVAEKEPATTNTAQPLPASTTTATTTVTTSNKRKHDEEEDIDFTKLTDEQREAKIVETLQRLKALIEERKPSMLASYNAECERVQEERKKLQIAQAAEGAPHIEKRLPKRRFPWCGRARALLARLTALAGAQHAAAALLAARALPLFPSGFVRMPTLLRQADLSKEIKVSDLKLQRLGSASQLALTHIQTNSQPPATATIPFSEPIQFPSSLTVTTTLKSSPEKNEPMETDEKYKSNSVFGSIINSFSLNKDLLVEKEKKDEKKEELYIPPNNIGSITITAVPNQPKEKKTSVIGTDKPITSGLIRVKSPAALNDMVSKKDVKVIKKQEKTHSNTKEKRVESPLHIDTSYQPSKKDPSPKNIDGNHQSSKKDPSPKNIDGNQQSSKKDPSPKSKDEISKKQIETMRVAENNIPRPALVPVHHSPTFAKPDKRPPEGKKKKDIIVVSDVDPLADLVEEPLNVDDSSSDVEVIETTDKSDSLVPSKDKKSSEKSVPKVKDGTGVDEEATNADIDTLMRSLQEMKDSQGPTKFNSNSYGGVIAGAKRELASIKGGRYERTVIFETERNEDRFAERTSLNKMDGSDTITG